MSHARVLFAPNIDMLDARSMQNIEADVDSMPMSMYRIGEIDAESERQIMVPKAAELFREFITADGDTYKFSYKALLYQVGKLNETTDKELRAAIPENVWVRRTVSFDYFRSYGMFPYCEHPDLSLATFGAPYTSLRVPDHVEPIPLETLKRLLEALACAYNLDNEALRGSFSPKSETGKALANMRQQQPKFGTRSMEDHYPMKDIAIWGGLVQLGPRQAADRGGSLGKLKSK